MPFVWHWPFFLFPVWMYRICVYACAYEYSYTYEENICAVTYVSLWLCMWRPARNIFLDLSQNYLLRKEFLFNLKLANLICLTLLISEWSHTSAPWVLGWQFTWPNFSMTVANQVSSFCMFTVINLSIKETSQNFSDFSENKCIIKHSKD